MHAEPFDYRRADSVDEAVELLETTEDAKLLAGGQALIPLLKKRKVAPGTLVDIAGIEALQGIERTDSGLRIGALSTHREVTESELVRDVAPTVPKAVSKITGGMQVHNVATIGGNVARAHPAYDYEGALLASDATLRLHGPEGERQVPVAEFVSGACETCLGATELITAVEIPATTGPVGGGYAKRKEPASGGAVVGVATALEFDSSARDVVTSARIAVNGLQDRAVRLPAAEDALEGRQVGRPAIERAADAAGTTLDQDAVLDNKKASAAYRLCLLGPYVEQSIRQTQKA